MLSDYKIQGKTAKLSVEIESELLELLAEMQAHTHFSASEIMNTALKRFIAVHKDFFPAEKKS